MRSQWSDPTAPPLFRQTVYRERFSDGTEPIDAGYPDGTSPGAFADRPFGAVARVVPAPPVVLPDDLALAVDFGLPIDVTSPSGPPPLGPSQALLRTPTVATPAGPRALDARELNAQRQVRAQRQESAQRHSVAQRQAWVERQPVLEPPQTSRFARSQPTPWSAPVLASIPAPTAAAAAAMASRLSGRSAPTPTVPWTSGTTTGQLAVPARWRTGGPGPIRVAGRKKRTGAWVGLLIFAGIVFAGNGGAKFVGGLVNRNAVPDGAKVAVATYYQEVGRQSPTLTQSIVCPAHRAPWLKGQAKASSDSKRGLAFDRQVKAKKTSDGYSVTVSVFVRDKAQAVTVGVTKSGSTYFVCSGISP